MKFLPNPKTPQNVSGERKIQKTVPHQESTVAEIKSYLDSQEIDYPSTAKKSELLNLIGEVNE